MDLVARQLAAQDPGEDVIGIICRHRCLRFRHSQQVQPRKRRALWIAAGSMPVKLGPESRSGLPEWRHLLELLDLLGDEFALVLEEIGHGPPQ